MKKLFGLTVLAVVIVLAGAFNVMADDMVCRRKLLIDATVDGNLIVDDGSCMIFTTTVEGNVHVEGTGSLLSMMSNVGGNIQCDFCISVQVFGGSIGGDFQVKGASGPAPSLYRDTSIGGNVQLEESSGMVVAATSPNVGGDVQAFKNTGGVIIGGNAIKGNLQCKENSSATRGIFGPNTVVDGNKEDQCAEELGF